MEDAKSNSSLSTGLSSSGFYGAPSSLSTKYSSSNKSTLSSKGTKPSKKRKDGRINKNVSHNIRKPKVSKLRTKIGSKVSKMRGKPIRMPSRLATNRTTLREGKKAKLHKLSSPGVSLLEDPVSEAPSPTKKKFFTTRSEEAAVVNISKTIKLSAVNGEVSINIRPRALPKKNIGRKIEEELNNHIASGVFNNSPTECIEPSDPASNILIAESASPSRKINNTSFAPLTPIRQRVSAISINGKSPAKRELVNKMRRISPRKQSTNSVSKENIPAEPTRKSPRKLIYSGRNLISPRKFAANNVINQSPSNSSLKNITDEWEDLNESFDVNVSEDAILFELLADNEITKEIIQTSRPIATNSPRRSPRKEMKNVKYFPIFDPRQKQIENKIKKKRGNTKRSLVLTSDSKQMTIDAGQSIYGAVYCKSCGFLYEAGEPSDEQLHNEFHNGLSKALAFNGWKNERLVTNVDKYGGRILKIITNDSTNWWRKVTEIIEMVDTELGFIQSGTIVKERSTAFLYIKNKSVSGCLIVEDIDKAFKFIQQVTGLNEGALLCCSSVPQKAFVGVSRIWVSAADRRTGIASALIDAMRANMYPCHYLTTNEFAFSDPTEQGMQFAKNYTKVNDFLVYRRSEAFTKNNLS